MKKKKIGEGEESSNEEEKLENQPSSSTLPQPSQLQHQITTS